MSNERVTLQDLADRLNLSRATVSLALRGAGRVSQETRSRVRRLAEEMGYRPDPLLSSFSRHRQKGASPGAVLAMVTAEPRAAWQDPLFVTASRLGYRLEVFTWGDYPSQQALAHTLEARGVAGVIFIEAREMPLLDKALWQRFRGIQCGHYPSGDDADSPFPIVRHNPFDAVSMAWRKGVETGHQRIALLLPIRQDEMENVDEKTLAGFLYRQQHEQTPVPPLTPRILGTPQIRPRQPAVEEATHAWVAHEKPDLVICGTLLGYEHLCECGFRIPQDFRAIVLRKGSVRTEIAGLLLDRVAVIQTAIFHLHTIIQHGPELQDVHATTIVLNPIWQDGASFPSAQS